MYFTIFALSIVSICASTVSVSPSSPGSPLLPTSFINLVSPFPSHITPSTHSFSLHHTTGMSKSVHLPVFQQLYDGSVWVSDGVVVQRGEGELGGAVEGEDQVFYGVVGVIELAGEQVAVAVKERQRVGFIPRVKTARNDSNNNNSSNNTNVKVEKIAVWMIKAVQFIPLNGGHTPQSPIVESIQFLLESGWYYADGDCNLSGRWNTATFLSDQGFHANHQMAKQALNIGFPSSLLVTAIYGHVDIQIVPVGEDELTVALLSRTHCLHMGTRYKARGVNKQGHCGNTVETEQILVFDGTNEESQRTIRTVSHLQLRGSVPLRWSQESDVKVSGEGELDLHLHWLTDRYPSRQIHLLNLMESKRASPESELSRQFEAAITKRSPTPFPNITYTHFAYHSHISKNPSPTSSSKSSTKAKNDGVDWKRIIIQSIRPIANTGFCLSVDGIEKCHESAVIRTNCLDCMDRTSKTQYALLSSSLLPMLHSCFPNQANLITLSTLDLIAAIVRTQWLHASNVISMHYSGTDAHQNGLIVDGYQSLGGHLQDTLTSIKRSVNFYVFDEVKNAGMRMVFLGREGEEEEERVGKGRRKDRGEETAESITERPTSSPIDIYSKPKSKRQK